MESLVSLEEKNEYFLRLTTSSCLSDLIVAFKLNNF